MTLADALDECVTWNVPSRIKVMPEGKFTRIVQLDYKPTEKQIAKSTEDQRIADILADFDL